MQTTNADGSSAIGEKVKTVDSIVVWPEDLVARRWKSSNLQVCEAKLQTMKHRRGMGTLKGDIMQSL